MTRAETPTIHPEASPSAYYHHAHPERRHHRGPLPASTARARQIHRLPLRQHLDSSILPPVLILPGLGGLERLAREHGAARGGVGHEEELCVCGDVCVEVVKGRGGVVYQQHSVE